MGIRATALSMLVSVHAPDSLAVARVLGLQTFHETSNCPY